MVLYILAANQNPRWIKKSTMFDPHLFIPHLVLIAEDACCDRGRKKHWAKNKKSDGGVLLITQNRRNSIFFFFLDTYIYFYFCTLIYLHQ